MPYARAAGSRFTTGNCRHALENYRAVNRFPIFAGAAALMAMLPCAALSAPTGGAVYRAAPIVVRPAPLPQRASGQARGDVTVPLHIDAAPKRAIPDTLTMPGTQWYSRHAWTWRPNYVWFANPCFANGANWAPLQSSSDTGQSALNDVKIGSLAGDPKHSVLGAHGSDIANLASSSTAALDSSGKSTLEIQWQPSVCSGQW